MYMKNVFYFSLTFLAIIIGTIFLSNSGGFRGYEDNANYSYDAPVMMFNKTGQVRRQVKIWSDTVAITTASGQVIDISSAGFTGITNVQIQAESNTASASNAPFMSIKTFTATTVTVNTLQFNLIQA